MLKFKKVLYYSTLVFSLAIGIWHFFVPLMFEWYKYLPMEYENLIVGIDWTNYCFSALLTGVSLILLIWGRRAFKGSKETKELYLFLTIIWVFRACLALFIEPWPLQPVLWAAILQLVLSCLCAIFMVTETVLLYKVKDEKRELNDKN